jgi:hypothetical protein
MRYINISHHVQCTTMLIYGINFISFYIFANLTNCFKKHPPINMNILCKSDPWQCRDVILIISAINKCHGSLLHKIFILIGGCFLKQFVKFAKI